jgi:hypothetical protein
MRDENVIPYSPSEKTIKTLGGEKGSQDSEVAARKAVP